MLNDFIVANHARILEGTFRRAKARMGPDCTESQLEHGIPLFLTQLVKALGVAASERALHPGDAKHASSRINDSAALNGHELLSRGFTFEQVVHVYGDVCQVVTELAGDSETTISTQDFNVFNGCLDDAIAGAVTAFGQHRERELAYEDSERLGALVHELRNLLNNAVLSFDAMRKGSVGVGGSTGAIHARSLAGLSALIDRSLAEARRGAGLPNLEQVSLAAFIAEVKIGAELQAKSLGLQLKVGAVDPELAIVADRQLLTSALSNLLQNAFKFTRAHGQVSLTTRATLDRVQIEVADECGGLPLGQSEELFRPFSQASANRSGLGLGLWIAANAVRANSGELRVRDVPGTGCVFSIELPRHIASPTN